MRRTDQIRRNGYVAKSGLSGQLVQGLMAVLRFHFMAKKEPFDRKMKGMKYFHFVIIYQMK